MMVTMYPLKVITETTTEKDRYHAYLVNMFITQARKTDQSDRSVGVEYLSIIHPNIPPQYSTPGTGHASRCVGTDTSSSN